jgi:hypothetical protein
LEAVQALQGPDLQVQAIQDHPPGQAEAAHHTADHQAVVTLAVLLEAAAAAVAAEDQVAAAVAAPEGNNQNNIFQVINIIPTVNGRECFTKNEKYEKVYIVSSFSLRNNNRSLFTEC